MDGRLLRASIWPRRQRRGENGFGGESSRGCWLQFGHDVSVVENACTSCRAKSRKRCFNLATTSASWRTPNLRGVRRSNPTGASIWPRRQRRGEQVCSRTDPCRSSRLQFGHDVSVVENVRRGEGGLRRGGASIWPRRQRRGEQETTPVYYAIGSKLQFGHDVSVVENGKDPQAPPTPGDEALQFGHDVSVVENREVYGQRGRGHTASIWPRRQRRGERLAVAAAYAAVEVLQFGHDVSVVENPVPGLL